MRDDTTLQHSNGRRKNPAKSTFKRNPKNTVKYQLGKNANDFWVQKKSVYMIEVGGCDQDGLKRVTRMVRVAKRIISKSFCCDAC